MQDLLATAVREENFLLAAELKDKIDTTKKVVCVSVDESDRYNLRYLARLT